jgi:hypothetical protein
LTTRAARRRTLPAAEVERSPRERHNAIFGIEDDVGAEGDHQVLGGDAEAAVADERTEDEKAVQERMAQLRNPLEQYRILNPETIELRSLVDVDAYFCKHKHRTDVLYPDPKPPVCTHAKCTEQKLSGPESEPQLRYYELRLAFTQRDERVRHVWDHIEHLTSVVREALLRYHPDAIIDNDWLAAHPGALETALKSPNTRMAVRDVLAHLSPETARAIVEGIDGEALILATLAIMRAFTDRRERILKKATGATASA